MVRIEDGNSLLEAALKGNCVAKLMKQMALGCEGRENYNPLNPPILTSPEERAAILVISRQKAGDAQNFTPLTLAERIHRTTLERGIFGR